MQMLAESDERQNRSGRLVAVDMARALTAIAVVSIHVVGYSLGRDTAGTAGQVADQVLILALRFSRLVFMLLSGFTLAYTYRNRTVGYGSFLARRGWRTALPYLTWSVIYSMVDVHYGIPPASTDFLQTYVTPLLTGTAFYHLYFMVVSLQWYLLFPGVLALLRRLYDRSLWIAAGTVFVGYLGLSPLLHAGALAAYRDEFVGSYLGYYLLGTIAGLRGEALLAWVRRHGNLVFVSAAGMLSYLIWDLLRSGPAGYTAALDVFRPAIYLYGLLVAAALLAVGQALAEIGGRLTDSLQRVARDSFTIYLAHPLVLFLVEFYALRELPWQRIYTLPLIALGVLVPILAVRAMEHAPTLALFFLGRRIAGRAELSGTV